MVVFDSVVDEYIPLAINNSAACAASQSNLLLLRPQHSQHEQCQRSLADTCDNRWSGAGQVYVRRAPRDSAFHFIRTSAVGQHQRPGIRLQKIGRCRLALNPSKTGAFTLVSGGDTWFSDSAGLTLSFIVG
jgi:hypothetical protein